MTINQEMLLAAARAVGVLGEAGTTETVRFCQGLLAPDGGFADRAGKSDLYYTVFGLQACAALGAALPGQTVRDYLESFGNGERLDSVHLSCLARCWAVLGAKACPQAVGSAVLERIEACRSADGGPANHVPHSSGMEIWDSQRRLLGGA